LIGPVEVLQKRFNAHFCQGEILAGRAYNTVDEYGKFIRADVDDFQAASQQSLL
jgi:hypothetical protein